MTDNRSTISVIVTTYNPDQDFINRFGVLTAYCEHIIICDNTPGKHEFGTIPDEFIISADGVNRGIGAALNRGIEIAKNAGCEYVCLFDQDSSPNGELIELLSKHFNDQSQESQSKACISPTFIDDTNTSNPANSFRPTSLEQRNALPTSGMFFPTKCLNENAKFSESIFVDWADHEWCYRLSKNGWTFYRDPNLYLTHRLGEREARILGKRFYVPTPFRHYYQVRDAISLCRLDYVPVSAKLRMLLSIPARLLLYPIILDNGFERFKWMLIGVLSALKCETGSGRCAHIVNKVLNQ